MRMSLYVLNRNDDYKNHIKCISEDQKYGGKGYEAKANKGDVKQQQWIQVKYRKAMPTSVILHMRLWECFIAFLFFTKEGP